MLVILKQDIKQLLLDLYPEHINTIDTLQLYSIDQKFGDFALNIGYLLAKAASMPLSDINENIASKLNTLSYVRKVDILNGFINVQLFVHFYRDLCKQIFDEQSRYGAKTALNAIINFDFASMNPTGPMHAGHLSSAILADTLCNILAFQGYTVQREYYINDTGGQIERLVQAVYVRYCELYQVQLECDKEYVGEYLINIAEQLKAEYNDYWLGRSFEEYYEIFRSKTVDILLQEIRMDLSDLGIKHDIYFSEHAMKNSSEVQKAYEMLVLRNLVKKQLLEKPADWKGEYVSMYINGLELDNQFRPLFKRDSTHTYLMGDIAYHANRAARCDWIIDCFGADHFEHANMLKEIMPKMLVSDSASNAEKHVIIAESGKKPLKFDIKLCQMVKFHQNGQAVKFSKRTGNYVTARDIIDAIGKDALRIIMLTRKANAHFTVELSQLMKIDDNNPVFYIQYAYARCCSALFKLTLDDIQQKIDSITEYTMSDEFLDEYHVKKLLNKMLFWPQMLEQCMHTLEPHGLLIYMQEMAKTFHSIWYHGGAIQILQLTREHNGYYPGILLCVLFKHIFGSGLKLLNIEALENMTKI